MFLIKPLKEKVIDPATGESLPEAGIKREALGSYWFRRQRDQDVSVTEISAAEEAPVSFAAQTSPKKKGV